MHDPICWPAVCLLCGGGGWAAQGTPCSASDVHRPTRCPVSVSALLTWQPVYPAEPVAGRREDYSPEDVEYYFNYMGMLAEEGSYDSLDALVQSESLASCSSLTNCKPRQ